MTGIYTVTPERPACYGVGCHQHAACSRYHRVENMPAHEVVIGTCDPHQKGAYPHFLPLSQTEAA